MNPPLDSTPGLQIYLREIGRLPRLRKGEEVTLALRIQKGDPEACGQLVQGSLRLVVKLAKEFEGRGLDLLDLISEGNIGLMKAAKRFDPSLGVQFSTYARFWIRQTIGRALANQSHTVRMPVSADARLLQIHRAGSQLTASLRRDPTDAEIGRETGLPETEVRRLRTASLQPVSLDQPMGNEENSSPLDFIADEQALAPSEILARHNDLELVGQALGKLNRMERAVLWHRFGMDGNGQRSLAEVGRHLGFTREWTRRIHNRALTRLRGILTKSNREEWTV